MDAKFKGTSFEQVLDIVRALSSRNIERSASSFALHIYESSCEPPRTTIPAGRREGDTESSFKLMKGRII